MLASDALAHLLDHFTLTRCGANIDGDISYDFDGSFEFTATESGAETIALIAALPELDEIDIADIGRALLAAGVQGAETGAGQIGLHPELGVSLIEMVDTGPLDTQGFELRVVNFSLYAEYWRSERAAQIVAEATGIDLVSPAEMMIRL